MRRLRGRRRKNFPIYESIGHCPPCPKKVYQSKGLYPLNNGSVLNKRSEYGNWPCPSILISSKSLPLPTLTILRLEWILSCCKECTGYGEITICWHGECNPHFIGSWAGSAMFKAYKAFGQGKWGHVSLCMPKISLNLINGPLLTYTKSSAKKLLACI